MLALSLLGGTLLYLQPAVSWLTLPPAGPGRTGFLLLSKSDSDSDLSSSL